MAFERHRSCIPINDVNIRETEAVVSWPINQYRGIPKQNSIKLIVISLIDNSPQISDLSYDLCPNILTGKVNFYRVNGWKCFENVLCEGK